jgi:hypothetical protein
MNGVIPEDDKEDCSETNTIPSKVKKVNNLS